MERRTDRVLICTPCKRRARAEYASWRAYLRMVIRYMELRIMGTRKRTPRTARANAKGASGFFCGKRHLRGGYRCRTGTQRQRAKSILNTYKTMKTYKVNPDDVAKLIGYTKYTVYKLTLKNDEYIMLWLKKHKILRAKYVFEMIKAYQAQVRKRKVCDKSPQERNINDVVREKKQNELFIINEKISHLEADMAAVVFDREINSQLQALYIKRKCLHDFLGINDEAKTEWVL